MKWSYGVTTVPSRFDKLLPRTLSSLAQGGFDQPRLFVDGADSLPVSLRGYQVTFRNPAVKTFGNWVLAAWELYLRDPSADRYAIFQDDFVTYKNLRTYLENCPYPEKGYCNLYTFPENVKKNENGWYLANQRGLGAVGLVFDNLALRTLLATEHMVNRPLDAQRGWRAIDGGIVASMRKAGWKEWVHNPTLVQHTGDYSSMGNSHQPKSPTFRGEDFDARELIEKLPEARPSVPGHSRLGLVGYHCATGLGELNRQIHKYTALDAWMIKPHTNNPTFPHPRDVDVIVCPHGQPAKVDKFLKLIDVAIFCERPFYDTLVQMGKKMGKRLVCVPMMEWMPAGARGWPKLVDLFLCPTKQCYDQFKRVVPCKHFPWPVDTERFQFKKRTTCTKFLYVAGHGGWKGRKGIDVVLRAKELWPAMPLVVISQKHVDWPRGVEVISPQDQNSTLYAEGDVLIVPHSVDGLGLEPMEAMACGMPVISTDGLPWNEIPSIGKIAAGSHRRVVQRPVDWYTPDPQSLVSVCQALLGKDIEQDSLSARKWAEDRSWEKRADEFLELVLRGKGD